MAAAGGMSDSDTDSIIELPQQPRQKRERFTRELRAAAAAAARHEMEQEQRREQMAAAAEERAKRRERSPGEPSGWCPVRTEDGVIGFVRLDKMDVEADRSSAVTLHSTGIYDAPTSHGERLATLEKGEIVFLASQPPPLQRRPAPRAQPSAAEAAAILAAETERDTGTMGLSQLPRGTLVEVCGMLSEQGAQLNGARGLVAGEQDGWILVDLGKELGQKGFHSNNLRSLDAGDGMRRPRAGPPERVGQMCARPSGPLPEGQATRFAPGGNPADPMLPPKDDDPRRGRKPDVRRRGLNSESFDPASTLVRPGMRIRLGPNAGNYTRPLSHDDVVMVPELFCQEDDTSVYYRLVAEIRKLQDMDAAPGWQPWHEGCHLIVKDPDRSPTYQKIVGRLCEYFRIRRETAGTRFNWYRDSSDWKPLHHDSAAFNAQRATRQNITVGVSFGAERELVFKSARDGTLLYFPQTNGMTFSFGRDVNILWKHGVNALPSDKQTGRGRISIILWGWCDLTFEEPGSPPMLVNGSGGSRDAEQQQQQQQQQDDLQQMRGAPQWGPPQPAGPCRDFARGHCAYGQRCKFRHPQDAAGGQRGREPRQQWSAMQMQAAGIAAMQAAQCVGMQFGAAAQQAGLAQGDPQRKKRRKERAAEASA